MRDRIEFISLCWERDGETWVAQTIVGTYRRSGAGGLHQVWTPSQGAGSGHPAYRTSDAASAVEWAQKHFENVIKTAIVGVR